MRTYYLGDFMVIEYISEYGSNVFIISKISNFLDLNIPRSSRDSGLYFVDDPGIINFVLTPSQRKRLTMKFVVSYYQDSNKVFTFPLLSLNSWLEEHSGIENEILEEIKRNAEKYQGDSYICYD